MTAMPDIPIGGIEFESIKSNGIRGWIRSILEILENEWKYCSSAAWIGEAVGGLLVRFHAPYSALLTVVQLFSIAYYSFIAPFSRAISGTWNAIQTINGFIADTDLVMQFKITTDLFRTEILSNQFDDHLLNLFIHFPVICLSRKMFPPLYDIQCPVIGIDYTLGIFVPFDFTINRGRLVIKRCCHCFWGLAWSQCVPDIKPFIMLKCWYCFMGVVPLVWVRFFRSINPTSL